MNGTPVMKENVPADIANQIFANLQHTYGETDFTAIGVVISELIKIASERAAATVDIARDESRNRIGRAEDHMRAFSSMIAESDKLTHNWMSQLFDQKVSLSAKG